MYYIPIVNMCVSVLVQTTLFYIKLHCLVKMVYTVVGIWLKYTIILIVNI